MDSTGPILTSQPFPAYVCRLDGRSGRQPPQVDGEDQYQNETEPERRNGETADGDDHAHGTERAPARLATGLAITRIGSPGTA